MDIITFKKGKKIIEIEKFDQKENGGTGITFTLYYYPYGLSFDYDEGLTESFNTVREAVEKALELLGE